MHTQSIVFWDLLKSIYITHVLDSFLPLKMFRNAYETTKMFTVHFKYRFSNFACFD